MPNTREKLVELLRGCPYRPRPNCLWELIADYLIANGVTVQQWISVKDRLPEKTEHDWVLVQLKLVPEDAYGVPCVAELRNGEWYDAEGCLIGTDPEGGCVIVTHWMPLPQPPKGE